MTNYQGVIFDMDGLLFDTEQVYLDVNVTLAPDFGLHGLDKSYMMNFIGISDEEVFATIRKDFSHLPSKTLDDFFYAGRSLVREMFEGGKTPLKPGAVETLELLRKHQIPSVIASSNLREFIELLTEKANIDHYFSGIVSANEVERAKPDPEIVIKATELLSLEPEKCLMLEDSLNGVRASHEANVDVIVIPDLIAPNPEMTSKAKVIVDNLFEAHPYIVNV
ncbi:HAD family hydrolase [Vagococcus elongatus]|uniref:HAD family hydrolase n=1 Tax=Vagococcus elongatus TaxID=180344 RepID=A0A430ARN4_9ENTE|nr:HAD family phosphatase [Vagococcus elongatus]RSU10715.1 hypothetical protein CBF29_09020 [Vagococcus elongatus]